MESSLSIIPFPFSRIALRSQSRDLTMIHRSMILNRCCGLPLLVPPSACGLIEDEDGGDEDGLVLFVPVVNDEELVGVAEAVPRG